LEEPIMTSPHNGSQAGSGSNLPTIRSAAPVTTSEVTAPEVTASTAYPAAPNLADQTRRQRIERRVRKLHIRADYLMKGRVRHPHGGDGKVEDIEQKVEKQREQIQDEVAKGSLKHKRQEPWIGRIPRCVLAFDFFLVTYFFAGITNVNWASPQSMDLAFAVVLAAMVTVLSYGFLAYTGHRLRSHRAHDGTVLHDLDGFTKIAVGVGAAVIAVIATLMFLRMRTEVLDALGVQAAMTALVIAMALAIVSAAANFLVIAIHAHDGSDQVAELDMMSASTRRPSAKAHRMRERAARQANQ
jgi:hypothetical protein